MDRWDKVAADRLAGHQVYSAGYPYTRQFGEVFATALKRAYAAGVEDAAKVCEAAANRWGNSRDDVHNEALEAAARAIRALPGKEGE